MREREREREREAVMRLPPAKDRNMGQVSVSELINLACHERRVNFLYNLASITYTNIILVDAVN